MAVKKYRFRFRGPTSTDVTREVGTTVTRDEPQPSLLGITGVVYDDYSIEETRLQDLKDYLLNPGGLAGTWEFVGQV
jgi:hypothetical protein